MVPDIPKNLTEVKARIEAAAIATGRNASEISLVAISKYHPAARISEAIAAGQINFGENQVKEAEEKWLRLKLAHPNICLHLVGPLQTNKTKRAVELFDVFETVDRLKLARALAREMDAQGRRPKCLIQVNTGEEKQKAGVLPAGADAFITRCRDELELPVVGLMCIPPVDDEAAFHFGLLATIAERHGLEKLSMGMSDDFEIAIRFGASHVRVGTAIFGSRLSGQ